MGELANLQDTENALDCDIKEAEKEKERLIKEEERYWKEYSKHRRDCILIEDKQKRLVFLNTYMKLMDNLAFFKLFET